LELPVVKRMTESQAEPSHLRAKKGKIRHSQFACLSKDKDHESLKRVVFQAKNLSVLFFNKELE